MNEDLFIFNAARLHLADKNIAALKELTGSGLDWQAVSKKASSHGVSQFIYYAFKQHDLIELLPKELFDRFKNEYYDTAIRNAKLIDAFKQIASILPNKIIPLKGIELTQILYPNIAIRSMCDIDLLVEQNCAEESWNRLRECGWHSSPIYAVKKSKVHGALQETPGHLFPLYLNGISVEIHWSLFKNNRFEDVTKKAVASSAAVSGNVYRLSQEMMLVHLCSHFCKHLWHKVILRELCDINELVLKHKDTLDWNEVERICSEPELRNDVAIALSYAHVLLDAPVPERFLAEKVLKRRAAVVSSFLAGGIHFEKIRTILFGRLKNYFLTLKNMPGLADKAVFIARTFVPKKEWIAGKYDVSTGARLAMAYPKYWLHLVRVYLIGR